MEASQPYDAAPPNEAGRWSIVSHQRHLPGLDGLRALAVGVVIAYHAGAPIEGDLGVTLFFVLSGFLITLLLLREHNATGSISLRDFYTRRILRIFPAYYAFITLSYIADRAFGYTWPQGLAPASLLYLVNYFNALSGHHQRTIGHAWSLAVEEQFYLCWPLLLLWLTNAGRRAAIRGTAILIAIVLGWRTIAFVGLDWGAAYVYNAFDTRFGSLAIGCLLALSSDSLALNRFVEAISRRWWMPLVTVAALFVSRAHVGTTYHYTIGFSVDALLCAALLVQLVILSQTRAWGWLNLPLVRYLGALSYSLYLYHQWGLNIGSKFGVGLGPLKVVLGVAASIALAMASYGFVERPFLAWKARLATRARAMASD